VNWSALTYSNAPRQLWNLSFSTLIMNTLVSRFSPSAAQVDIRRAREMAEEEDFGDDALWGSSGGFGNLGKAGVPNFHLPMVVNVGSLYTAVQYNWA
jgi:hypothetical protein